MPLLFIVLGIFLIAMALMGKMPAIIDQLFGTEPKNYRTPNA